jgi:hypothetical protein
MLFCRFCGKEIHEAAMTCPHCGGVQHPTVTRAIHSTESTDGPLWVPITSLVLGIICVLFLFDDLQWDKDTVVGLGGSSLAGFVLGAISLINQKAGKVMAIIGVVLSSVGLLAFVGMFLK